MKPTSIDWATSPDDRPEAPPTAAPSDAPIPRGPAAYCMTCRSEMVPCEPRPGWWTCEACGHDKPEGMTFALPPARLPRRKSGSAAPHAARAPRASAPLAQVRPWTEAPRTNARPPVLAINTYAGSLLVGARSAGLDVVGSYEDSGFGTRWQNANFPGLAGFVAAERSQWPAASLRGAIVIAHPPCAAFSVQAKGTTSASGKSFGLDSEHFKCTTGVIRYALGLECDALLLESVQPALEGARSAHDDLAAEFGYRRFRVLQNAATFGLPQWRARFWIVYLRPDVATRMAFVHEPACVTVGQALAADPGPAHELDAQWFEKQRAFLVAQGLTQETADEAMAATSARLPSVLKRLLKSSDPEKVLSKKYCFGAPVRNLHKNGPQTCSWMSEVLRALDPDGLAPVVMHNSWWSHAGRTLSPAEYRAIMGFPRDYELDGAFRMWLSKGVCPPVAAWLLEQVARTIERGELPLSGVRWCEDGETVDLQISRDEWRVRAGVADAKPTDAAAAAKDDAVRGPKTTKVESVVGPDGRRKKRVSGVYLIEGAEPLDVGAIGAAFASSRASVVVPPLLRIVSIAGRMATVELQYEPPNAGGHTGDVDRIAERGARRLGGGWRRA